MSEWIADIWVEGIPKTQGSMRSVGPGNYCPECHLTMIK